MKFLFDMFPVILFFGVFKWGEGHTDAAQSMVGQYLSGLVSGGNVGPEQAPILLATAVGTYFGTRRLNTRRPGRVRVIKMPPVV